MDWIVILFALLARKFVDFIRYVVHGDVNGMVTQIIAWLMGILTIYFLVWTQWPNVPELTWERLLWGLLVGGAASTVHDFLCSLGRTWGNRHLVEPAPIVHAQPD